VKEESIPYMWMVPFVKISTIGDDHNRIEIRVRPRRVNLNHLSHRVESPETDHSILGQVGIQRCVFLIPENNTVVDEKGKRGKKEWICLQHKNPLSLSPPRSFPTCSKKEPYV
jgi:hypothetical protein